MAEHCMPFCKAEDLVETMQKMFPDSTICKSMTMKRTKVAYIIQEGIVFQEKT